MRVPKIALVHAELSDFPPLPGRRAAYGTAVRPGIVAADKIASCMSGNAMETILTVGRGNPAHRTAVTVYSIVKNSRDNPSDFSVQ